MGIKRFPDESTLGQWLRGIGDAGAQVPERITDYQTTDAIWRPVVNLLLEEFLFTYWIDLAAKEVQITETLKV